MPASHRGTGFVGLNTYLGLNQGAATRMGGALSDDVEAKGGAYATGLQGATDDFNKQLGSAGDLGVADPNSVTSEQAAELAGRQWGGPSGLDTGAVGNLYGMASAAQNAANATGTNAGRQTLLAKHYGGANTWGGGALDANLAGAGGGAGGMAKSRGAYGKLIASLGTAQQGARDSASAAKKAFDESTAAWGSRVPGLQQKERLQNAAKNLPAPGEYEVGEYGPQTEEERKRYP
jgi:hypothetical protein